MGGPGCSIPIRETLSEDRLEHLLAWIYSLNDYEGRGSAWWHTDADSWSFSIGRGEPLGFTGEVEDARPFSLSLVNNETEDDIPWSAGYTEWWSGRYIDAYVIKEELAHARRQWLTHFGYYPAQRLELSAHCNSSIDHRLLAHLALRVAEDFEGIIDLHGALRPPSPPRPPLRRKASPKEIVDWLNSIPAPTPEEIRAFVQQLPGRVYELTDYDPLQNETRPRHILDLDALCGWLRHPHFHMVK